MHGIANSAQAVSEQEQIVGWASGVICSARLSLSAGLMNMFRKINPSCCSAGGISALLLLPALPPRTHIRALFWALPWRPRPRKVRPFGDPRRSREGRRLSSRYRLPPPEPPAGAAPRLCRYPLRQESRWREIRATASHANHTTPHHTICCIGEVGCCN